ncbi:hypothetical protein AMTRI_Chr02g261260 [Amborella trichopoda]
MVAKDYNQEGIDNEYKYSIVVKTITYKDLALFGDLTKCAFQVQSEVPNMSLQHTVLTNRGKQSHSSK